MTETQRERAHILAEKLYWLFKDGHTHEGDAIPDLIEAAFLEWHEAMLKRSPRWTEEEIAVEKTRQKVRDSLFYAVNPNAKPLSDD